MQRIVGLLMMFLLTGCQGFPLQESLREEDQSQVMSLWERYQRCQTATDPVELVHIAQLFDAVTMRGVEPPSWLEGWGHHVKAQPIRAAIDPGALGAACTLRAAALVANIDRIADARALYERMLLKYAGPDWVYYTAQAREALARLSDLRPAIAASSLRPYTPLQR